MPRFRSALIAALALALAPQAAAQTPPATAAPQPAPELTRRIAELPAVLRGEAPYAEYFAPGFIASVPENSFKMLVQQISSQVGTIQRAELVSANGPHGAAIRLVFERGAAAATIAVDAAEPHRVVGLLITSLTPTLASLDAGVAAVAALPGTTGLALARLGPKGPARLRAHNAGQPLAIGSAFKLVILAELVRATNAGQRRWDDAVPLPATPLPGGRYAGKPAGTKVPLRELAEAMISVSDNSATDVLLGLLGRTRVEAMQKTVGIADPARNRPFLSTLEAFKLKLVDGGAFADRYLALNTARRRALLAGPIAALPLSRIDEAPFRAQRPTRIADIEWFASADDLVRVMDWLRRKTEGNPVARAILSRNPGIGAAPEWRYIGYKGGSEPGVINMTLLLQSPAAEWFALSASWNNRDAPVDEGKFAGLMSGIAALIPQKQ